MGKQQMAEMRVVGKATSVCLCRSLIFQDMDMDMDKDTDADADMESGPGCGSTGPIPAML